MKNMNKQDLILGAKQYADYITKEIPQKDADGNLLYYFSGSLVFDLLSSTSTMKLQNLDKDGKLLKDLGEIKNTSQSDYFFRKLTRPLSLDIDVISIDEEIFRDKEKIINLKAVRENCDKALNLCPAWERINGTMYLDALANDRKFSSHMIAVLTLDNGSNVVVCSPVDLLTHKLGEMIAMDPLKFNNQDKYQQKLEKDISDFSCLFNGLSTLNLIPQNLDCFLTEIINRCPDSAISRLAYHEKQSRINDMFRSIEPNIENVEKDKFTEFMSSIKIFNEKCLQKNM